jgi:hypothetical protein
MAQIFGSQSVSGVFCCDSPDYGANGAFQGIGKAWRSIEQMKRYQLDGMVMIEYLTCCAIKMADLGGFFLRFS